MANQRPANGAESAAVRGETLAEFRQSFFYGSRTDLLFKFLAHLSDQEAGEFLRGLLEKLGETVDDGDATRLLEHVFQWNVRGYAFEKNDRWQYEQGPFTPLARPLSQSRVGLLTTTGHFVAGDDPAPFGITGMTQQEAIPRAKEFGKIPAVLSRVPVDTPRKNLRVRHPGFDVRGVERDHNVALPLDGMAALAGEGVIGEFLPDAFSFVGLTAQTPLIKTLAPQWAGMLKERRVDAMVLVPV